MDLIHDSMVSPRVRFGNRIGSMNRTDHIAEEFLRPSREGAVLESLSLALYQEAREDPDEPVSPVRLARRLLGADGVRLVPRLALQTDWAALIQINGHPCIAVRRDVPDAELGHTIARALAKWALRRAQLLDANDICDYVAAALVAPAPAFRRALSSIGPNLPELADVFRTTQSLVALRWGESTARPLALVRPGLVRVRNVREFAWPPDPVVWKWARVRPPVSLERTTLTDDRRRVLLVAKSDAPRTYQKRLGLS